MIFSWPRATNASTSNMAAALADVVHGRKREGEEGLHRSVLFVQPAFNESPLQIRERAREQPSIARDIAAMRAETCQGLVQHAGAPHAATARSVERKRQGLPPGG